MSNRQIRQRAWQLYRKSFRPLLWLGVLSCIPAIVQAFLSSRMWVNIAIWLDCLELLNEGLTKLITIAATVFTYPLQLGVTRQFLQVFNTQGFEQSDVREMYERPYRKAAFQLALLIQLIFLLIDLPFFVIQNANGFFSIPLDITYWMQRSMLASLLEMIKAFIKMMVTYRLLLIPYVFVQQPRAKIVPLIKASLAATKEWTWRIFGFVLMIELPITAGWVVCELVGLLPSLPDVFYWLDWRTWLPVLVTVVTMPYIELSLAGFAQRMLDGSSKIPELPIREIEEEEEENPSEDKE